MLMFLITFISAISISAVAAYFSIIGLMALFAATAIPVAVMAGALEVGKLVAVSWLHTNWNIATNQIKIYLISSITVLMIITSIGIFGFLSKGFLDQNLPIQTIELQVTRIKETIERRNIERLRNEQSLENLNKSIETFQRNDRATQAEAVRTRQTQERNQLNSRINELTKEIDVLNDQLSELKLKSNEVSAKLGPIQYVADLFGWTDTGSAVRFLIIMIMFVFDPFAVALLLAAQISYNKFDNRNIKSKIDVNKEEKNEDDLVEIIKKDPKLKDDLSNLLKEAEETNTEIDRPKGFPLGNINN